MTEGYIALVGSRKAPVVTLELFNWLGRYITDRGYAVSSGDALGVDRAGWEGAIQSSRYSIVESRIFLVDFEGPRKHRASLDNNFIDSSNLEPSIQTEAYSIAQSVAPHITRLNDYVRSLHTRNVYQILGANLKNPVKAIFYYAEPLEGDETVAGGTNTALQVAKLAKIPIRINLWGLTKADLELVLEVECKELFTEIREVNVYTIQLARWRELKDTDVVIKDITFKSGNRSFSPDAKLFRSTKYGETTRDEYVVEYRKLMQQSARENYTQWIELLEDPKIALACYCKAGGFCHRLLFVEYLTTFAKHLGVTVNNLGEYPTKG